MTSVDSLEDTLRQLHAEVLRGLVTRYGDDPRCQDAAQEALLAASQQWPRDGIPENPGGWLATVARRRWTEMWRSDTARERREQQASASAVPLPPAGPAEDDTVTLLCMCCHPCLTRASQVALTLRTLGGLSTAEIARGLLIPETTVAQRITRAKRRLREQGARFERPGQGELRERTAAVAEVLYLIFTEGHTATSGNRLHRVELTGEAIRLTRLLHVELPDDGEVAGLLALMLLTDARRASRTRPDGTLVPLAEQDRTRWDRDLIAEGVAIVSAALARHPIGPYQIQAAIAAVHDEAASAEETDWQQIVTLYGLLERVAPGPMVTLNRIVAVAALHGPEQGLRQLAELDRQHRPEDLEHRVEAVTGFLLDRCGRPAEARRHYARAARLAVNSVERRHLLARARGAPVPPD